MTRYGHESHSEKAMILDFYLIVGRGTNNSQRPSVRVGASYPSLSRNERAINLKIKLPLALFETPPITATITVAEPDGAASIDLTAVAESVRQAIGMDVDIQVARDD
ncbi:MAG: hypothetical protein ACREBK_07665 [Sphingomicrobium sp.]